MKSLLQCFTLALFGMGCASGPLVTVCISNPVSQNFICHNQAQKKNITMKPAQVDGWIFMSAADESSFLNACKNKQTAKVNVCVFSASTLNYACFNEVSNNADGMTYAQSNNWIGLSAVDTQIVLNFCVNH